jgi:excisionase family DNA binding protein
MQDSEFLTLNEVTRLLNLTKTTAWRLTKTGKLKSYKFGKNIRIKQTALQEFIERSAAVVSSQIK